MNYHVLPEDWKEAIRAEIRKPYFIELAKFIHERRKEVAVYPDDAQVLRALQLTSLSEVRVVIIGQDPYPSKGTANGLAFSCNKGHKIKPSLLNILTEARCSYHHGYLTKWAEQGVLLLNTIMTVEEGTSLSHAKKGWERFTDRLIEIINQKHQPVVFMLWGNNARAKKELINTERHLVLETSHPSPNSVFRGFMGCGHFKGTNDFLEFLKSSPIDWSLRDVEHKTHRRA